MALCRLQSASGSGKFGKGYRKMSEDNEYAGGSNEIDEYREGEIAERQSATVSRFGTYLRERAELEAPIVAAELSADQMNRILTAETPEELDEAMKLAGLIGLRDLDNGQEIQISGYHLAVGSRSEFMNRFGVFAVLQCTDLESGQQFNADTGIERILAYLRMCEQFERFPLAVQIVKTPTAKGEMIT